MDPAVSIHDFWWDARIHDAVNGVANVLAGGDQQREEHKHDHRALKFESNAKTVAQARRLTDLVMKSEDGVVNPDGVKLEEVLERFEKSQHCRV